MSEFSIEHKIPWQSAEDPKESFFDLDNIAFSHLKCNIKAASKDARRELVYKTSPGTLWCTGCQCERLISCFTKDSASRLGFSAYCRECKSDDNRKQRERRRILKTSSLSPLVAARSNIKMAVVAPIW